MGKTPQPTPFLRRESIVPIPPNNPQWSIHSDMPNSCFVTSKKFYPSSNFKYPPTLDSYGISKIEWDDFTLAIRTLARWDGDEASHVKTNVALCVVGFVLIPGLWPAWAFFGRRYYKNRRSVMEHAHITSRTMMSSNGQMANLAEVVKRYNDVLFGPAGLQMKLSIPDSADRLKIHGPGNRVTILIAPKSSHGRQEETSTQTGLPMTPSQILGIGNSPGGNADGRS